MLNLAGIWELDFNILYVIEKVFHGRGGQD